MFGGASCLFGKNPIGIKTEGSTVKVQDLFAVVSMAGLRGEMNCSITYWSFRAFD